MKEMLNGQYKTFVKTLFEGVEDLQIDPETLQIVGISSRHGEQIKLLSKIKTVGLSPDVWMEGIQDQIIRFLKKSFFDTYEDMDLDIPSVPEDFKEL